MLASRCNQDTAGGIITPLQTFTRLDGEPWAVIGSPVTAHAPCPRVPIHCAAVMATGSKFTRINDVPVCRFGDLASCGHPATGRPWIRVHS